MTNGEEHGVSRSEDVAGLLRELEEARNLEEGEERAARLAWLGREVLRSEDACVDDDAIDAAIEAAIEGLHEAMRLGSAEAAYTLGCLMLEDSSTLGDFHSALMLLERAATAELRVAQDLLGKLLLESEETRRAGEEWLVRARLN